jgi:aerobic-type carbon monoxide dehydrogenase small subunit (CoxS/CutS family)
LNSCLCPIYAVNGTQITTVEGVSKINTPQSRAESVQVEGGETPQLSIIQKAMTENFGSQCGYCTPVSYIYFYEFY